MATSRPRKFNSPVSWVAAAAMLVALLCIAVFLSGCPSDKPSSTNGSEPLEARFAVFQLYVSAPIVAALESTEITGKTDCFAEAGLRPTIIKRGKGPDIVDALVSGSADFGTLALTPIALQALQGKNIVIFATIQTTNKDIKVVARRDRGIKSGSDLKGKKLGYVGGTFGEIFLDRYLKKHGLDRSQVSLVTGAPPQLRDLFIAKSVDAIVIWEPFIQDLLRDPSIDKQTLFVDVDTSLYTGTMNLVALPETLTKKRKEAEALVRAMICAEDVLHKYPSQVQQKLEVWLDRKGGTLTGVFDPAVFRVGLDKPFLVRGLDDELKWGEEAVYHGKATMPSRTDVLIDVGIMAAVAPDRLKK